MNAEYEQSRCFNFYIEFYLSNVDEVKIKKLLYWS